MTDQHFAREGIMGAAPSYSQLVQAKLELGQIEFRFREVTCGTPLDQAGQLLENSPSLELRRAAPREISLVAALAWHVSCEVTVER